LGAGGITASVKKRETEEWGQQDCVCRDSEVEARDAAA
jgi:hypothetical protein